MRPRGILIYTVQMTLVNEYPQKINLKYYETIARLNRIVHHHLEKYDLVLLDLSK